MTHRVPFSQRNHSCKALNLSKQITVLEDAGYVSVEKIVRGRRVLTEIAITEQGASAYQSQWAPLKRLAGEEKNPEEPNTQE